VDFESLAVAGFTIEAPVFWSFGGRGSRLIRPARKNQINLLRKIHDILSVKLILILLFIHFLAPKRNLYDF